MGKIELRHSSPSAKRWGSVLSLVSSSRAEDAAFTALQDATTAAEGKEFVIIGGLMVSILEATQNPRRIGRKHTKDADLGLHRREADVSAVRQRLENLDGAAYTRSSGHLFHRVPTEEGAPPPIIDVLVASYQTRHRKDIVVGGIVTIEVPGLADALNYKTLYSVELTWSNGTQRTINVPVPDLHVALALKLFAWRERRAGKDAVDVFRCARLCVGAGLNAECWEGLADTKSRARRVVENSFSATKAEGVEAMGTYLRLSKHDLEAYSAEVRAGLNLVFGIVTL